MIKIITIITILFCSKVIAVDKPAILEASQKLSLSPEQAGLLLILSKQGIVLMRVNCFYNCMMHLLIYISKNSL